MEMIVITTRRLTFHYTTMASVGDCDCNRLKLRKKGRKYQIFI